jgi:hypothetical protein
MIASYAREGCAGGQGLRQRIIPKVLRQRTDLECDPALVLRAPDRMALHRAWQADAERFR